MDIQTKNALKIAGGVLAAIWGVAAATANSSRGSGYDPRSYPDTPDTEPRAISLTEAREPGSTHVPYSPPQPSRRPRYWPVIPSNPKCAALGATVHFTPANILTEIERLQPSTGCRSFGRWRHERARMGRVPVVRERAGRVDRGRCRGLLAGRYWDGLRWTLRVSSDGVVSNRSALSGFISHNGRRRRR